MARSGVFLALIAVAAVSGGRLFRCASVVSKGLLAAVEGSTVRSDCARAAPRKRNATRADGNIAPISTGAYGEGAAL